MPSYLSRKATVGMSISSSRLSLDLNSFNRASFCLSPEPWSRHWPCSNASVKGCSFLQFHSHLLVVVILLSHLGSRIPFSIAVLKSCREDFKSVMVSSTVLFVVHELEIAISVSIWNMSMDELLRLSIWVDFVRNPTISRLLKTKLGINYLDPATGTGNNINIKQMPNYRKYFRQLINYFYWLYWLPYSSRFSIT